MVMDILFTTALPEYFFTSSQVSRRAIALSRTPNIYHISQVVL